MKWIVKSSRISGSIVIPPSKSHTIRALLIASLANGVSRIERPLVSGDGASAIGAAKSMGARIEQQDNCLVVAGVAGNYDLGDSSFDMGNSGTSTNLFASAAALGGRARRIDGDSSLRMRPVKPLLEALSRLGASCKFEAAGRDLPFVVTGPLKGGKTIVDGISSQFVSSLLLSCPLAPGDTDIEVVNIHERPYIEITLWWLDKMGIRYEKNSDFSHFHIYGGQSYKPVEMKIPGDFSSATFPAIAAAVTGIGVDIKGIDFTDPQGDKKIFDILEAFGGNVRRDRFSAYIEDSSLIGAEIDLNEMPDALPAVAVLGCASRGVTRIVNVAHARIKETDRIKVMAE
ncbi:MAG TPA: 3-phosphoshikimate 1-carboxyvinyltransferase, partial [Fibrobacteres bacterium]|nr:3-phosphoshikimate 1-carboxyvinyltransferase [Fibrobacterota bacterium]